MRTKAEILLAARLICEIQEWRARWEIEVSVWGETLATTAPFPYDKEVGEIAVILLKGEAENLGMDFTEEDAAHMSGLVEETNAYRCIHGRDE